MKKIWNVNRKRSDMKRRRLFERALCESAEGTKAQKECEVHVFNNCAGATK